MGEKAGIWTCCGANLATKFNWLQNPKLDSKNVYKNTPRNTWSGAESTSLGGGSLLSSLPAIWTTLLATGPIFQDDLLCAYIYQNFGPATQTALGKFLLNQNQPKLKRCWDGPWETHAQNPAHLIAAGCLPNCKSRQVPWEWKTEQK